MKKNFRLRIETTGNLTSSLTKNASKQRWHGRVIYGTRSMSNPLDFARAKTESIIKGFDGHLMNNTKWVKILKALSESDLVLESKVKLVWDEELRDFGIRYAGYCHDFYDSNMEAMISGHPKGFYDYKEIEWVDFPAEVEVLVNPDNIKSGTRLATQDIQAIFKIISNIGMFELESSDSNLRLYGYK